MRKRHFMPAAVLIAAFVWHAPPAFSQAARDLGAAGRDRLPETMMDMMRDCRLHMRDASQAAETARRALAAARKSGDTARMQKAMADAEAVLEGMGDHMGGCMSMMGPMGGGGGPEGELGDQDRMLEHHRRMHERMNRPATPGKTGSQRKPNTQ